VVTSGNAIPLTWLGREFRDRRMETTFQNSIWPQNARLGRVTSYLALAATVGGDIGTVIDDAVHVSLPAYAATRLLALLALSLLIRSFSQPAPQSVSQGAAATFAAMSLTIVWLSPTLFGTATVSSQLAAMVGALLIIFVVPKPYISTVVTVFGLIIPALIMVLLAPPQVFAGTHPASVFAFFVALALTGLSLIRRLNESARIAYATRNSLTSERDSIQRAAEEQTRMLDLLAVQESELQSKNALMESILAHADQGIVVVDAVGQVVAWNQRYVEMYGLSPNFMKTGITLDELTAHFLETGLFHTNGLTSEAALMVQNPKGGQNFELTLLDGRFFDIRRSSMPGGGYVSTTTDITARRRIEAELGARNQFVESVLRSISQGIVAFDRNKQIVAWNDQYRDFFDLPVDLLRPGVPRSAIITHLTERGYFGRRYLDANARMQIDEPLPDQRFEIRLPDGRVLDIRREPLPEGGIVTTYTDITEQKRAEDTIRRLALLDPLTGLANRARFDQRLAEAIANAVENQSRVALLLIDLDFFKPVNDTHGHAVGDVVLRRVGRILAQTVRDIDTAARIGGDEFAVILPHLPDTSVAERIAQRIIETIQLPIAIDDLTVSIGASVGIAIAPDNGTTPESLRDLGDAALYLAKGAGRGVWRRAA